MLHADAVLGIGTALPAHVVRQEDAGRAVAEWFPNGHAARTLAPRVFRLAARSIANPVKAAKSSGYPLLREITENLTKILQMDRMLLWFNNVKAALIASK